MQVLLAFANKNDMPNSLPIDQMLINIGLDKVKNRKWFIQSSCGMKGDGLYEGLDWLSCALNGTESKYRYNIDEEGISWIDYSNFAIVMKNKRKTILLISG